MLGFLKKLFLPDDLASNAQSQRKTSKSSVSNPPKASASKAAVPKATSTQARANAGQDLKSDDSATRLKALQSIDDLTVLADRTKNDTDAKVRQLAHSRLKARLLDPSCPMAERIRSLSVLDAALIETTGHTP